MFDFYTRLWNKIIRPDKCLYTLSELGLLYCYLGPKYFTAGMYQV